MRATVYSIVELCPVGRTTFTDPVKPGLVISFYKAHDLPNGLQKTTAFPKSEGKNLVGLQVYWTPTRNKKKERWIKRN